MAATPQMNPSEREYLQAMVASCEGDPTRQVSMYTVGESVGLDRDTASRVCQELIAFGLVEIKTLSGGVGLTEAGVAAGGMSAGGEAGAGPRLKKGPILDEEDRQAVTALLDALKQAAAGWQLDYEGMSAFVIDVKTIETQLLAPAPKTAVITAVCDSLIALLDHRDAAAAGKLRALTGG